MALFFWYGVSYFYSDEGDKRSARWGRTAFLLSVISLGPLFGLLVLSGR